MGKSSKDRRDIYYRKAKEEGWRARSAFKLLQLDLKYNLFESKPFDGQLEINIKFVDVTKVVDLCAAPGSWSQVLAQRLCVEKNVRIVAVDLQPMAPLPGVVQIQGDITKSSTVENILAHLDEHKADLVVCDGAPDVIGLHSMDVYIQGQLIISALKIACNVLRDGGNFVAKLYRGKNNHCLTYQLKKLFTRVEVAKPKCSRNSSIEAFVVCLGYIPNEYQIEHLQWFGDETKNTVRFSICGEEDAFDSDTTYPLQLEGEEEYRYREPVQAPIAPPYYFVPSGTGTLTR